MSPVSANNSRVVYDALKASGIRLLSALPETWLVHLIRMADDDPEMILVRLASTASLSRTSHEPWPAECWRRYCIS